MKINKTDTGYTLRQSPFPAAAGGMILGMGLILMGFTLPFLSITSGAKELAGMIFLVIFLAVFTGTGIYVFITNLGRRLILDADGVHLQCTLLKERFLPWSKVRDLGCTHEDGTYRHRNQRKHYFYVSPTRLGSNGSIRVIHPHNRALLLSVSRDEIDELYGQGVIDFCEKQANEGREEWDRVVPYFSLAINRH